MNCSCRHVVCHMNGVHKPGQCQASASVSEPGGLCSYCRAVLKVEGPDDSDMHIDSLEEEDD